MSVGAHAFVTLLLRHIAAVAMNVIGVPDSLQWGREAGRDGTDGTVVTTCSSITIKKSNVSGMAQRNPQFAYETIELFVKATHAPTLQFLENNSALLLMMVQSIVQGAQGLTEQQIMNEFNSALSSRWVAVGLPNPPHALQEEGAAAP